MATKTFFFTGTVKWAKVFKPDEKFEPQYSLQLFLDDDGWATWKASGLGGKVKEDEDGKYVTFRRKVAGPSWEPVLGPPKVTSADGKPFEGLIGNGSTLTVKVDVYDTAKGKGHRLEGVRVDELVVYEKPTEDEVPDEPEPPKVRAKGLPF